MNQVLHDQLNKLRLISKLKEKHSLETTGGLSVYEPGYMSWFFRKWSHDGKDEVVRFLQEFYRSIDQSAEQLITDIKTAKDETKRVRSLHVAVSLAEKLKTSIRGIEMLSKTYSQFAKTTAVLEGIVQDFAIVTYKQILDVIPKEQLSKSLRESITYNGVVLYQGLDTEPPGLDC